MTKPNATPRVAILEWRPLCVSGISSSTTPYTPRRKPQQVRQHGKQQVNQQYGSEPRYGLHHARPHTVGKGLPAAADAHLQRHRDNGPLGEILYGDTYRQGHRPSHRDPRILGQGSRQHHTHSHAFGYIVQGHGQHQHRRLAQAGFHTLGLVGVDMLVRDECIEQQQREHSRKESERNGHPAYAALLDGHVYRWYQQRPHRRGHHHARSEPQQQFLQTRRHVAPQHEYHCRPERRARKWYQQAICHTAVNHVAETLLQVFETIDNHAEVRMRIDELVV